MSQAPKNTHDRDLLPARIEMQERLDPLIAERAPWLYSGKPHHTLAKHLMMRLLRYPRSIELAAEFRDLPTEEIMRRISALIVRDLPGVKLEIARLLPQQLHLLVSHSRGDLTSPRFTYGVNPDELSERFERKIPLNLAQGKTSYETVDFGEYLKAGGVFDDDFIDSYIELKMTEVIRFEHTPHPVEYDMYYSA